MYLCWQILLGAEIWAIYEGIKRAKEVSARNLVIESNCLKAVEIISGISVAERSEAVVQAIQWAKYTWLDIFIRHIFRKANTAVHWLATDTHNNFYGKFLCMV